MLSVVDHLVLSTPDLDEGIGYIEHLLGTEVVPGGRHPDYGTSNALVSLGEHMYLEIVGPDPQRSTARMPVLFRINQVNEPRLVTWAAKGPKLADTVASARTAGIDLGEISGGARLRPDGTTLRWRLTDPYTDRMAGIIPFFIDWGDTTHPAATLPAQCELLTVNLDHPDAEKAERGLRAVGVITQVVTSDTARIRATIRTPDGIIELT